MKFTGERMIPDENRHDAIYAEHLNRYFFASHFVKNRTVLDIASGSGYGSELLQKAGARRVYGVDIAEEAIEFGKELYKDVEFRKGSVEDIPLQDGEVDVIVSFETLEHVDGRVQSVFMTEVERVLREDGTLIISTPNTLVYPKGNRFHVKELDIDEFESLMRGSFEYVHMLYQDNAETNYIFTKEALLQEEASADFRSHKINTIDPKESRYLVAVCSNAKVRKVRGETILFDSIPRKKYEKYEKELAYRQKEFEERTEWALKLDKELAERTEWALKLDKELAERTEWALKLDKELAERTEWALKLDKELAERTEWALKLDHELADRNKELAGIKSSATWRASQAARRLWRVLARTRRGKDEA